jgi:hypothetical protein
MKTIYTTGIIVLLSAMMVMPAMAQDEILWEYTGDASGVWPTDADRLDNDNTLIADANGRIIEVDPSGTIVWEYWGDASGIDPYDADRLDNDNTLIADAWDCRVIEVDPSGTIVWEYWGDIWGDIDPYDADRLDNNNTLIADGYGERVIEVDPSGTIVWEYTGDASGVTPIDADRLDNDNTLIADWNGRVIEVDPSGTIFWEYATGLTRPSDADRLDNGNTLIADTNNARVIEVGIPPTFEFGDAPDPTYPSLLASNGARHIPTDTEFLGLQSTGDWKDFEPDAKIIDLDLFDDGLSPSILTTENPAQTVDFEVTNLIQDDQTLIVNILLDLNGDGDWSDIIGTQSEHVVQNQAIPLTGIAEGTFTSLPFSTVGATDGPTWMRITLTRHQINPGWDGTMASAGYAEPFECGETEDWLVELQVPPKANVFLDPGDIRLPKYCDTTNVSVWVDTEEAITSGQMIFDYTYCCMNVTDFQFNDTNWNVPPSGWSWAPGRVTIIPVNLVGDGVGPGLVHVGDLTVHCCNDTGYCETDLTWDKDPANSYLFNATPAKMTAIGWHDGTFRCNIPDLVITAVKGNEISGMHYNVSYTVKNIGDVDASESYANLLVDDVQVETMFVPALAPGAEYADSFELEINQTGTVDHLLVCADWNDTVVELDEDNNCMIGRYPGEVVIKVQPAVTYVQPQCLCCPVSPDIQYKHSQGRDTE